MNNNQDIYNLIKDFSKNPSEQDKEILAQYINSLLENKGIGTMDDFYLNTTPSQNKAIEYAKICKFLDSYLTHFSTSHGISKENLGLEFINYGKTQLVYVLSQKDSSELLTLLVKQPEVEFGAVKQECINLQTLASSSKNIVSPVEYFSQDNQELYVTPYINQARCIASDKTWGLYIPEPYYRFEPFTKQQESVVNTCMIAKLVSLYNPTTQQGLAQCRLGGGDFILPKGWEETPPTIEDTLDNMQLIAARQTITCPFENYKELIVQEFSQTTINKDGFIINDRGRVAMNPQDIQNGIELGEQLLPSQPITTQTGMEQ